MKDLFFVSAISIWTFTSMLGFLFCRFSWWLRSVSSDIRYTDTGGPGAANMSSTSSNSYVMFSTVF